MPPRHIKLGGEPAEKRVHRTPHPSTTPGQIPTSKKVTQPSIETAKIATIVANVTKGKTKHVKQISEQVQTQIAEAYKKAVGQVMPTLGKGIPKPDSAYGGITEADYLQMVKKYNEQQTAEAPEAQAGQLVIKADSIVKMPPGLPHYQIPIAEQVLDALYAAVDKNVDKLVKTNLGWPPPNINIDFATEFTHYYPSVTFNRKRLSIGQEVKVDVAPGVTISLLRTVVGDVLCFRDAQQKVQERNAGHSNKEVFEDAHARLEVFFDDTAKLVTLGAGTFSPDSSGSGPTITVF
jgi:hypothetical protein